MTDISLSLFSDQLADAVAAVAPSVVQVQGRRRPVSGVVYGPGLVLATARALGREEGVRVRAHDDRTFDAEFGGWDPATGLVILRASGLDAPALSPSDLAPRVGHLALAVARSWPDSMFSPSRTRFGNPSAWFSKTHRSITDSRRKKI